MSHRNNNNNHHRDKYNDPVRSKRERQAHPKDASEEVQDFYVREMIHELDRVMTDIQTGFRHYSPPPSPHRFWTEPADDDHAEDEAWDVPLQDIITSFGTFAEFKDPPPHGPRALIEAGPLIPSAALFASTPARIDVTLTPRRPGSSADPERVTAQTTPPLISQQQQLQQMQPPAASFDFSERPTEHADTAIAAYRAAVRRLRYLEMAAAGGLPEEHPAARQVVETHERLMAREREEEHIRTRLRQAYHQPPPLPTPLPMPPIPPRWMAAVGNNNNNNSFNSSYPASVYSSSSSSPFDRDLQEKSKPKCQTTYPDPWPDEPQLQDKDAKQACTLCEEHKCNVVTYPCGHPCMCVACCMKMKKVDMEKSNEWSKCPVCRGDVRMYLRIFF